jgi:hypothetical protein
LLLNAYDSLVLGPIARFVWRAPTTQLVERYRGHIRDRHLDVGPGTGYFLEHAVIHCLPGPIERKAAAIANVAAVLAPTGVLFGASVIGTSGQHTWAARRFLGVFNRQGGFDNLGDTEDGLRDILEASFQDVELEAIGSMAVFAASNRRAEKPT